MFCIAIIIMFHKNVQGLIVEVPVFFFFLYSSGCSVTLLFLLQLTLTQLIFFFYVQTISLFHVYCFLQ